MQIMVPIPKNEDGWLKEIAKAYIDALDTIPFAESIGERIEQKDLFHLAPVITIKFRGMKRSEKLLDKITKGALASYIANEESHCHRRPKKQRKWRDKSRWSRKNIASVRSGRCLYPQLLRRAI